MRLRRLAPATRQLVVLSMISFHLSTTSAFITLSQFQEIDGFSVACTSAYNTPVPGCVSSDFEPQDAPCSQACANGLRTITTALNTACKGVAADPTTLIGLFFAGKGVHALCPKIGQSGDDSTSTAAAASTTEETSTSTSTTKSKSSTSTSTTTSSTESESKTTLSTSTTTTSSSASESTSERTTSENSSTTSNGAANTATSTSNADAEAAKTTDTSSSAPSSATSGPAVFGGGAIPFTVNNKAVEASSATNVACNSAVLTSIVGVCIWTLILAL